MWFIFIVLLVQGKCSEDYDYSNITCNGKEHTVTKYAGKTASGGCTELQTVDVGTELKDLILENHNSLRAKVAEGKQVGQPPAKHMPNLEWNDEIAMIAQTWADQCIWQHDECRNTRKNEPVGQNMAMQASSETLPDASTVIPVMIRNWYDEVKDFTWPKDGKFTGDNLAKTGHYTQLVWAATTHVGCGVTTYIMGESEPPMHTMLLVCNYLPAGNVLGQTIYETDESTESHAPLKLPRIWIMLLAFYCVLRNKLSSNST